MNIISTHELIWYSFQHGPADIPFVIAGNVCDLENRRIVTYEEGAALAAEHNCPFFECSAKTDQNVEKVFLSAASKGLQFACFDVYKHLIQKGDFVELQNRIAKMSIQHASRIKGCDEVSCQPQ